MRKRICDICCSHWLDALMAVVIVAGLYYLWRYAKQ